MHGNQGRRTAYILYLRGEACLIFNGMAWTLMNKLRLGLTGVLLCFYSDITFAQGSPSIKFVENKNQWPQQFHFSARVPGGRMFIEPGVFHYYFFDESKIQALHDQSHRPDNDGIPDDDWMIDGHAVQVKLLGSNSNSEPRMFGKSSEYYNYFLGQDTCSWASEAYAYEGFLYPSLYQGIDLKVYAAGQNLKYEFIVAPNANPNQITMEYLGALQLKIEDSGDLHVDASVAGITEKKPIVYQNISGKQVFISSRYKLNGKKLSFTLLEGYDPCYELVIDPLLIFSTYSGSTADNWGSTATPGEGGNLYSAGVTNLMRFGGNFPATPGAFQIFYGGMFDVGILKYDSAGQQLLYASYLGGDESESAHSLVMNSRGDLIILGTTSSLDFPTTQNAYDRTFNGGSTVNDWVVPYRLGSDIFVARVNRTGTKLLSSTLLGGVANDGMSPFQGALEKNYGDQLRGDVITDSEDNVFISTMTSSSDFPAIGGMDNTYNGGPTDAVIAKLNLDLSQLIWSTFLGGQGEDASLTIKFDKTDRLLVAGGTTSANFPVTAGSYQPTIGGNADGWIAKISNSGDAIFQATFTGTSSFDQVYFLDLNENDEVYVYGQTSGSFPVTPGVYRNPNSGQFIQKFNQDLSTLIFSTVIGSGRGIPDISPTAFLVNECNNLYLAGWGGIVNSQTQHWPNNTIGMPVSPDAFQKTSSGSDFYFMVLTDDATQFLYGTYLGGTQSRTHVDGGTSRFDKGGIVYHAVCSGCEAYNASGSSTSDFPTTFGAWSNTNNSGNCNNAAFKFDLSSLRARLQSNSVALNNPGLNRVCLPDKLVFQNLSTGGEIFEWDLGDGTQLTKTDTSMVLHEYLGIGKYTVWLKAIDKGTCRVKDSTSLKVDVFDVHAEVQEDDAMCLESPYTLQASGGFSYEWISEDGSFQSTLATPVVNPEDTLRYFVTITEDNGCQLKDTVKLSVIPTIAPDFEIQRSPACFDLPAVEVISKTDSLWEGDRLLFDFGDGSTTEETEAVHVYKEDGVYAIKLIGIRDFCVTEKVVTMPVFKLKIPNIITPGREDNANDKFIIQYGDRVGDTPATYGYKTGVIIYNRWGTKVYEAADYEYDWEGEGLAAGVYYYELTVEGHATCKSWLQLIK